MSKSLFLQFEVAIFARKCVTKYCKLLYQKYLVDFVIILTFEQNIVQNLQKKLHKMQNLNTKVKYKTKSMNFISKMSTKQRYHNVIFKWNLRFPNHLKFLRQILVDI